jgi:hypothetical protein
MIFPDPIPSLSFESGRIRIHNNACSPCTWRPNKTTSKTKITNMIINSRKKREKILNQRNKRVDTDLKRTVFEAGSDEVDRFA